MVVACHFELWFVPASSGEPWSQIVTAEVVDEEGPDRVDDVIYTPPELGDDPAGQLLLIGGGFDPGGGLYSLVPGEETERIVPEQSSWSADAVVDHPHFTDGVYWSGSGYIHRWDPLTGSDELSLSSYQPWSVSFAIGDGGVYGPASMFVTKCAVAGCDETEIERVGPSGNSVVHGGLYLIHPILSASPGGVFGRVVYAVQGSWVSIITNDGGEDSLMRFITFEATTDFV